MRPEVLSISRITIIDVVDLPQPDLADKTDALAVADRKADAIDSTKLVRLGRRLAREQFAERGRRALAGIFLDQIFDGEKGFCSLSPLAGRGSG